jgi:hypothetical protein
MFPFSRIWRKRERKSPPCWTLFVGRVSMLTKRMKRKKELHNIMTLKNCPQMVPVHFSPCQRTLDVMLSQVAAPLSTGILSDSVGTASLVLNNQKHSFYSAYCIYLLYCHYYYYYYYCIYVLLKIKLRISHLLGSYSIRNIHFRLLSE